MDSNTEKVDDDLFDGIIEFGGNECDETDNQTHKKRNAKKLQMNKLKLFMAEHNELSVEKDEDLWGKLTNELNALGPPSFTPSEWKLKWSQHKYNKKRNLSTELAGVSTERAGSSTETAQPPTKIAKTSSSGEPVVERIVTLSDILTELKNVTKKQDEMIEQLNVLNKLLEKIADSLKK